jgi:hypothetical protein
MDAADAKVFDAVDALSSFADLFLDLRRLRLREGLRHY